MSINKRAREQKHTHAHTCRVQKQQQRQKISLKRNENTNEQYTYVQRRFQIQFRRLSSILFQEGCVVRTLTHAILINRF